VDATCPLELHVVESLATGAPAPSIIVSARKVCGATRHREHMAVHVLLRCRPDWTHLDHSFNLVVHVGASKPTHSWCTSQDRQRLGGADVQCTCSYHSASNTLFFGNTWLYMHKVSSRCLLTIFAQVLVTAMTSKITF
jgi:hypothetical protein